MAFEFRTYVPPQLMPQKLKRQQYTVSLPQNHIQTSNAAEDFDMIWPSRCTGETVKEITDETPGSPDELPSIEELLKANWPNGNTSTRLSVPSTFTSLDCITSSTSHVQTDSDTESSGKTRDCAIIVDGDTNPDHSVDSSKPLQSLDRTLLAPANGDADGSIGIIRKDADDNQPSAAEELLHAQVELDPAPIYSETTDFSTDPSIEAPFPAPATKMSVERAGLENSDAEARNESTSTSPAPDDSPTTPPVADEMSESEWEAVEIIGERMINGKPHFRVDWKPTYEPEENCVNMRELIEEWKKSKTRQRNSSQLRGTSGKTKRNGDKRSRRQTAPLAQGARILKKATEGQKQAKKSNTKVSTKRLRGRPRKA